MVDPTTITNFSRTDAELEEFAVFCVVVAGKNAISSAKAVYKLEDYLSLSLIALCDKTFLRMIDYYVEQSGLDKFAELLKMSGVGCNKAKSKTLAVLAHRVGLGETNLRTCSVEDLEQISGIGSKTARYFILHSRPAQRFAVLDTHILKYLRSLNLSINVPMSTPPKGSKVYKMLEATFLKQCDVQNKTPAVLDLELWNLYRNKI